MKIGKYFNQLKYERENWIFVLPLLSFIPCQKEMDWIFLLGSLCKSKTFSIVFMSMELAPLLEASKLCQILYNCEVIVD